MSARRVVSTALLVVALASPVRAQLPAGVDHYLCYAAANTRGAPAFTPVDRTLRDALQPLATFTLKRVAALCTAASKNGEPILHPDDHQVSYRIRAAKGTPRFTKRTLQTVDQFGTRSLEVTGPYGLLVPSSIDVGATSAPPYVGGAIRHYECYRARQHGFATPPPATVGDAIWTNTYAFRKVTKLCTPVDKAGEDPLAPGDPGHLVCLRVRNPGFSGSAAATNNQIRPEQLDVKRPLELCLPALVVDPSATTTTSSSTSSSSFLITTSTAGSPTTTTLPLPCGDPMSPPAPLCWGECPGATPICAVTGGGCACVAGSTPCGSASFPACDGACGAGEACVVSPSLGCTCQFQGIPCSASYALTGTCGGVCPDDYTCAGPFFTPDGDGCACVPIGSTCHLTCGSDPGAGNCPPGQTCGSSIPGLCLCQ